MTEREKLEAELNEAKAAWGAADDAWNEAYIARGEAKAAWGAAYDALKAYDNANEGEKKK